MNTEEEERRAAGEAHLLLPLTKRKQHTCLRLSNTRFNAQVSKSLTSSMSNNNRIFKSPQNYLAGKQLFVTLLVLPLLFILLLPSLKLDRRLDYTISHSPEITEVNLSEHHSKLITPSTASNLLLAHLSPLLRLPLDRIRLSVGLLGVAQAKLPEYRADRPQPDLLEEETHMQLQLPAEHRSSGSGSGGLGGSATAAAQASSPYLLSHYAPLTARSPARTNAEFGAYGGVAEAAAPASVHGDPSGGGGAIDYGGDRGPQSGEQVGELGGQPVGSVEGGESLSLGSAALQARADLPAVRALNVKCEKNHMTVNIIFDRPFYGTVFSKGHYNDQKCIHLPASSGQTSVNFDIHLGKCGVTSSDANGHLLRGQQQQGQLQTATSSGQPNGLYIENTIIIQYDPQVQEIYDQARKIRCTWYDYYEKSVSFRPYNVDMLDAVTANFLGDNIQCWMQIQVGKGPWSSEVAGIVKIGQTMTMVLAIKDDENRFDMLVRNCVAHDGKHQPIQLVDEYGCVARPKIMAKFQKVRNFGPAATVVSYAHFQAFKFPDSMSVNFQCVIQVCRYECPEPVCAGSPGPSQVGGLEAGGPPPSNDYAASGTEIVSSKEPAHSYFLSNNSLNNGPQAVSSVKLDESQGRAQVKLDTSMMAGSRSNVGAAAALPPHLLHATVADLPVGPAPLPIGYASPSGRGHSYMSASYYKPAVPSTLARPAHTQQQVGVGVAANGRPPTLRAPLSAHSIDPQYSPSIYHQSGRPTQHRTFPGNRMGELPPASVGSEGEATADLTSPLGLIARPRGLHSIPVAGLGGATIGKIARARRSIGAGQTTAKDSSYATLFELSHNITQAGKSALTGNQVQRVTRGTQEQESTAIKTQKSIQVVSPDDVAFNLLADEFEPFLTSTASNKPSKKPIGGEAIGSSVVCFSGAKLLVGVLISLSALIAGLMLAGYMLYLREGVRIPGEGKQESHVELEHPKRITALSSNLFGPNQTGTAGNLMTCSQSASISQSQQLAQLKMQEQQEQQQRLMLARRQYEQEEEIQQRNNYLARLYSQFVPATYWRQQ